MIFIYEGVYQEEKFKIAYPVYSGWLECWKFLLNKKWNFGFYSTSESTRNIAFRDWVEKKLELKQGSLFCYSKEDLACQNDFWQDETEDSKGVPWREVELALEDSETQNGPKKSLVNLGFDLSHTLLIDDNANLVPHTEWPQCILDAGDYVFRMNVSLEDLYGRKSPDWNNIIDSESWDYCLNFPRVVLKCLQQCCNVMERESCTLQEAAKAWLPSKQELVLNQKCIKSKSS
jgi:hypothetical protein